jgi:hypothetical protein
MDDGLRDAVEAQAAAHVARDQARFASHMTPGALVELGRELALARGIRVRRFHVHDITEDGTSGASEVRFEGSGFYLLIERWERGNSGWRVVSARCPADAIRRPWWRRLPFGRRHNTREREELA